MDDNGSTPAQMTKVGPTHWWAPFRHYAFAAVWAANILGLIGIAISDMASGWLMTSLNADPTSVARVQVAANLPMFLFTLMAGVFTDAFNIRRYLLLVQAIVLAVTLLFACLVSLHAVTPASLLAITFLLSAVWTFAAPAWLAVAPLLVPPAELDAATAVNSAGYNVSRAVGPALGGIAISALGIAAPFWIFCMISIASMGILIFWQGPPETATPLPKEKWFTALSVGFRHVANNRHIKRTLVRTVAFFPFASAYWALMPLLVREQMNAGPEAYGSMLSAIGAGAIAGAMGMTWLKSKLGPDRLVALGSVATAVILFGFALVREMWIGLGLCFLAGAAWIVVLATLYVSAQLALPNWVRGRGLAIFLTVIFGAMTFGGAIWGEAAQLAGLPLAHMAAAVCVVLAIPLTWAWRIETGATVDFSPSRHWRLPVADHPIRDAEGPVLVVVEYRVATGERDPFLQVLRELGQERKRDGAYSWSLLVDPCANDRFWEMFSIASWLELRHFCERTTNSDRLNEEQLRALVSVPPISTFMIGFHEARQI